MHSLFTSGFPAGVKSLPLKHLEEVPPDEITLIPYGCSTLRITEFPVVH
ncbi:MAG: hypothetical protein KAR19_02720 [Bacteroidales bacterium]|nr:hypothetical protein [Bacteroidales bacterium]